jgi:hypothetical protein
MASSGEAESPHTTRAGLHSNQQDTARLPALTTRRARFLFRCRRSPNVGVQRPPQPLTYAEGTDPHGGWTTLNALRCSWVPHPLGVGFAKGAGFDSLGPPSFHFHISSFYLGAWTTLNALIYSWVAHPLGVGFARVRGLTLPALPVSTFRFLVSTLA